MASFEPVYRLRIFATGSTQTPLTPAPGAPHSDDFVIATTQSLAGSQPYLGLPSGQKNIFDIVKKDSIIGSLKFRLMDKSLSTGNNLVRWVSAFVGDERGKVKLLGNECSVEESIDGGVTFLPFYFGVVESFQLSGEFNQYDLVVREKNETQRNIILFRGEPSASLLFSNSYGNRRQMVPWGSDGQYGPFPSYAKTIGTWRTSVSDRNRVIETDLANPFNNIVGGAHVSEPFMDEIPITGGENAVLEQSEGSSGPIVRVTSGATVGRFTATYGQLAFDLTGVSVDGPFFVAKLLLEPLDPSAFEYLALDGFSPGQAVRYQVLTNEPPTKEFPTLVGDVHPIQFLKDIYLGLHSALNPSDGKAIFSGSVDIDDASFDVLISDGKFKESRWLIEREISMRKFVSKNILDPYLLGFRMQATESFGRFFSKLVLFDLEAPATLSGIPTIETDEVVAGAPVSWEPGQTFEQFDFTTYQERYSRVSNGFIRGDEVRDPLTGPANPTLITQFPIIDSTIVVENITGKGNRTLQQDGLGLRWILNEQFYDIESDASGITNFTLTRKAMVERVSRQLKAQSIFRLGRGPATVTIDVRRTANTNDLQVGEWRLLDVDYLPDPFTHVRGGTRLMQCVERSERGNAIRFKFVDSGQNTQRAAPTMHEFTQIGATSAASGGISVGVTDSVETWFAMTPTDVATRPDETSSLWQFNRTQLIQGGTTGSVFLGPVAVGSRVWPRARSRPPIDEDNQIPSDFVFHPTPGYFDMSSALNPPTNLFVLNRTTVTADIRWVVGDTTASIEVLLKPESSSSFALVTRLTPRTTQYTLGGLSVAISENPYVVAIRHIDTRSGATSATASFMFATDPTTPPPACPTPGPVGFNTDTAPIPKRVPMF